MRTQFQDSSKTSIDGISPTKSLSVEADLIRLNEIEQIDFSISSLNKSKDWWLKASPNEIFLLRKQEAKDQQDRNIRDEELAYKMDLDQRFHERNLISRGVDLALSWLTFVGLVAAIGFEFFRPGTSPFLIYVICIGAVFYSRFSI